MGNETNAPNIDSVADASANVKSADAAEAVRLLDDAVCKMYYDFNNEVAKAYRRGDVIDAALNVAAIRRANAATGDQITATIVMDAVKRHLRPRHRI